MRSYGVITLVKNKWAIRTEPQVALRLKRVFQNISKSDHGCIFLSANPTSCRELIWFLQRYPMDMTNADKAFLEEKSAEHLETEAFAAKVLAGGYVPLEFDLALQPREYQRISADLAMKTGRLLIADEMGLGKTVQAICTFTDPSNLPALVVTLTHLPRQWEKEINRFIPKLRTHVVKKSTPYDVCKDSDGNKTLFPDVLIINYHKLGGWAETLSGVVKSVVYDECHELRRNESGKYKAAVHISESAKLKCGLSGTPIFNFGGEMFNVMNAIEPGCIGERDEFMREWCPAGGSEYNRDRPKIRDPQAFGSFLREQGLMIRRTRADVGRELKPLNKIVQHIDADEKSISDIEDSAAELAKIILSQNTLKKGVKMQAAEQLSNILRQVTGIGKAPFVADMARMVVESGEPLLLFGWHREFYSILKSKLADLSPVFYTGSENDKQKHESKEKFMNGDSKLLIMSLRSGAGLDGLQNVCSTVMFGELDWSFSAMEQGVTRIHRDGQLKCVMAYYLVCEYGSDPAMLDVIGEKKSQLQGIRDPNAELIELSQVTENNTKKLAESFLKQRGLEIKEPSSLSNIIQLKPTKESDEM